MRNTSVTINARLRTRQLVLLIVVGLATPATPVMSGGYGEASQERSAGTAIVSLSIGGMNSVLSAAVVAAALEAMEGVFQADVSYDSRRGTFRFDPDVVTDTAIAGAVEDLGGFDVRLLPAHTRSTTIRIPDLDTPEVGHQVNEVLSTVPGIMGGTIRAGFITVDYDSRVVTPEEIAEAIADKADLDTSDIAMPARDRPAPEDSAQVVVRIAGLEDYSSAVQVAQQISLDGIFDGSVNLEQNSITIIYEISELTAPDVMEGVNAAAPGETEVITIDKAGKPVSINVHGWFVMAVSALGVVIVVAGFFLFRRQQR